MINFLAFNFIVFVLIGGGYLFSNKYNRDYSFFDRTHTTIIKGIGALLVLWGHVAISNGIRGVQFIAGAGVSLFLICSGYGIEESFKKNGLKSFWKNRIIKVIIPYYIICFAGYIILNVNQLSIRGLVRILDFEFQWYINYILINYVIFYALSRICKDNKRLLYIGIAYSIWFILDSLFFASISAPFLRARQMWAFLLGIIVSHKKEGTEIVFGKWPFIFVNLFLGLGMMLYTNTSFVKALPIILSNLLSLFTVVPLACAVIGFTLKCKLLFRNYSILLSGKVSYEIFLIHSNCLSLCSGNIMLVPLFMLVVFGGSFIFNNVYNHQLERIQ